MKKLIIIISIFSFVLFAASCHEESPQGEIETPVNSEDFYSRNDSKIDEKKYKELSSHAYTGKVNGRDVIVSFTNESSNTPVYSSHECSIFSVKENDEDTYQSRTRYEVILGDEMTLNYIIGPEQSTYECEYKEGNLYLNGSILEATESIDQRYTYTSPPEPN